MIFAAHCTQRELPHSPQAGEAGRILTRPNASATEPGRARSAYRSRRRRLMPPHFGALAPFTLLAEVERRPARTREVSDAHRRIFQL
jgi:hypothetical protein